VALDVLARDRMMHWPTKRFVIFSHSTTDLTIWKRRCGTAAPPAPRAPTALVKQGSE